LFQSGKAILREGSTDGVAQVFFVAWLGQKAKNGTFVDRTDCGLHIGVASEHDPHDLRMLIGNFGQ